jgi:hypothetical protein
MALVLKNRVLETCTSPGTGTVTLLGATTGYQTFSATVGNGNTCYYTIADQGSANWEVGIGTYATTGNTLTRTTVLSSSNGGGLTNFSTGTQNVFVDYPAEKAVYLDASGNAIPLGSASATQLDITAQGDLRLQDTTGGEYVGIQAPATLAASYTLTMPTDDGTSGQALVTDGSGVLSWSTAASGDVYGPASATDNAVARFDLTTGKIIQNSAVTIGDDGATIIDVNSASAGLRITQIGAGNALLVEDAANPDSTPFLIDASGFVVSGSTASLTDGSIQTFKLDGIGANDFVRKNTAGSGIVLSGETVGNLRFYGFDGASYVRTAQIFSAVDGTPGTNDMPGRLVFSTTADGASSPTERMRIDQAGRIGVGTTSLIGYRFRVGGVFETTGTTGLAVAAETTIPSNVTSSAYGFYSAINTAASAFTLASLYHYRVAGQTPGAGSTVTTQYGFHADSGLTGATNNYGFYSAIASGTGRWNFYAAGTAVNYFAGNVGIGIDAPTQKLMMYQNAAVDVYTSLGNSVSTWLAGITSTGNYAIYSNSSSAITFSTAGVERGRISSTGVWSLGATVGSESLRVTPVASAVNYWNIYGGATGSGVALQASGSDTNINTSFYSKGSGNQIFASGGGSFPQFVVAHTASAVNYFQVNGGGTGSSPYLSAQGSDANIHSQYLSKGTYGHIFNTGSAGNYQFYVANTASAVNYIQVSGAATAGAPYLFSTGTDTNVGMQVSSKGTASISFFTNSFAQAQFSIAHTASAVNYISVFGAATGNGGYFQAAGSDTNIPLVYSSKGNREHAFYTDGNSFTQQFRIAHTASAVNYLQVTGSATGGLPNIAAAGSDANINIWYYSKGTGAHGFATNNTTQFYVAHTASAVNYLQVTGAATGVSPTISAQGSDTNIDLALTPKGTGVLSFGTYTAGIVAQAGYITIKDAGGTTRRLLVG